MLLAVLDLSTRQLTVASAGNPYPFLLRNGRAEEIAVSGIPQGVVKDTRYDAESLDLELGDVVVLISDGILECQNKEQQAFGGKRLRDVLTCLPQDASAQDISSAILDATDEFSRHTSAPEDDRSLLVLKVTDDAWPDYSGFRSFTEHLSIRGLEQRHFGIVFLQHCRKSRPLVWLAHSICKIMQNMV